MPRAASRVPRRKKHKKILSLAKGNVGGRRKLFKSAKETVEKGLQYAYRDRRAKKREFRQLWIARINAAVRQHGMSYSTFIHAMQEKNIQINRKALSELAIHDPQAFGELVKTVQQV
jgi:large subunit ribosomal protein L20